MACDARAVLPASPTPPELSEAEQAIVTNGGTFTIASPDARPTIDRNHAIAITREGGSGTPTSQFATLGTLRMPKLGARSERLAWLVVIEGIAPPAGPSQSPSEPRGSWAYIDAEDGRPLVSGSSGLGPPQP